MDSNFIENLLNTEQEKQLWQNINIRLEEQLQKLYQENIDKLAESAPSSGTKFLDDPIHPKHVTTAPREIIIHIEAETYRDWETDRKSTRLNSSHLKLSRMPSSA